METLILVILLAIWIGEVATIVIKAPMLRITLGDLGDFWVRVPQNTALAILKHKKLDKMIFAISENNLKKFPKEFRDKFNDPKEKRKYVLIPDVKKGGLYWIGPSFLGYEVYEWYETEEDEKDGINALHSIDLAEQVIKYLPQEPKKQKEGEKTIPIEKSEFDARYGVPSFKSKDNIEIRTSLAIFFVVKDPEKALFSVRYRKRAIQEQTFPLWRDVLGKFSFFSYKVEPGEGESETSTQKNPDIKTEASNALKVSFGLNEKEINGEAGWDPEGIAAKLFEKAWGMWVRDITVGELEAADPEIEDSLAAQMKAHTKALATIEEAKGKKMAFELEGAGKEEYIKRIIKGFSGGDKEKISEAIRATVEWRQFEALENMSGEGKYLYQWPQTQTPNSTNQLMNLLKNLDAGVLMNILQNIKK
ncbi:hypothetical protein KKE88_03295 [Patescibacteria group bacterium]|nr:hypothetical protein [Patescibacteria group bacterium]